MEDKIFYVLSENQGSGERDIVKDMIDSKKKRFIPTGDCTKCGNKNTPVRRMSGWRSTGYNEGKEVGIIWVCFECYLKEMEPFRNSFKKSYFMFMPDFVWDNTLGTYVAIKDDKIYMVS